MAGFATTILLIAERLTPLAVKAVNGVEGLGLEMVQVMVDFDVAKPATKLACDVPSVSVGANVAVPTPSTSTAKLGFNALLFSVKKPPMLPAAAGIRVA